MQPTNQRPTYDIRKFDVRFHVSGMEVRVVWAAVT